MPLNVNRREFLRDGALVAATLGGIRPAAAQTTQKRELVVAQGGDISKFDPHFSTSSNDIRVSLNLFDNLISRHPDGKLQPGLALEWRTTAPTAWAFKLRPGVRWHNGDPLEFTPNPNQQFEVRRFNLRLRRA
jgi:peptide/nickel transport system substrate-binding protein